MKLLLITSIFSLATCWPGMKPAHEPAGHEWHPPVGDDRRSPCVGLNTLSNHGYLPRDGKSISLPTVQSAVSLAFNYEPTTFDTAFAEAITFNLSTTGDSSTFNLDDLARHDAIEFDGSLTRNDAFFGDALSFDHAIWATTADRLRLDEDDGEGYVTIEAAAKARAARVEDAKRVNPKFNASAAQTRGSPGTTVLYLATLWDEEGKGVPKRWVKAWMGMERIPYLEGFVRPAVQKTGQTIKDMFDRVVAVKV